MYPKTSELPLEIKHAAWLHQAVSIRISPGLGIRPTRSFLVAREPMNLLFDLRGQRCESP